MRGFGANKSKRPRDWAAYYVFGAMLFPIFGVHDDGFVLKKKMEAIIL